MSSQRSLWGVLGILALPAILFACLWDYDTLKAERSRFPSVLELITGKFLRHSAEFYAWRIQDRLKRLATDPNQIELYDDLAVAYEKTGQHAKAVGTMETKENLKPGLYETYSNLGTLHILAGDFERGLPLIDKALAINPNAHFGREKYQKSLVEYAQSQRVSGKLRFPLRLAEPSPGAVGFHAHLIGDRNLPALELDERNAAIKGVLGMMRFANHDNPLLLEALGDLLLAEFGSPWDGKQLAARAYLKASQVVTDPTAQDSYRKLAEEALSLQVSGSGRVEQMTILEVERELATEQADADQWYGQVKEREFTWIREGLDADAEFDRLYQQEPEALERWHWPSIQEAAPFVAIGAIGGIALAAYLVLRGR